MSWEGKWVRLVFLGWCGSGVVGRELHAGLIVERGKGVVGGRAFVFNEKWENVEVTGGKRANMPSSSCRCRRSRDGPKRTSRR